MSDFSKFDKAKVPNNIVDRLDGVISELGQYQLLSDKSVDEAGSLAPTTGLQVVTLLVSPSANCDVTDPTDSNFSGVVLGSLDSVLLDGKKTNFVAINKGQVTLWINAEDGTLNAVLGKINLESDQMRIDGLLFPLVFEATNGTETRKAWLGMHLPEGSTVPAFGIFFTEPSGNSEMVVNGNAENGTTGWTNVTQVSSGTDGSATVAPYEGNYMFLQGASNSVSSRILVQSKETYIFSVATYKFGDVYINWYDDASGGNLLRRDTLHTEYAPYSPSKWKVTEQFYTAPKDAVSCTIEFAGVGNAYFDAVSMRQVEVNSAITLEPNFTVRGSPIDLEELTSIPPAPADGKGSLLWLSESKTPYFRRSGIPSLHEAIGLPLPLRRQAVGINSHGAGVLNPVNTSVFQTSGTVSGTKYRNGMPYKTINTPSTTNAVAGVNYFGQATGFFTVERSPYFACFIRTSFEKNYLIEAGFYSDLTAPSGDPYRARLHVTGSEGDSWMGSSNLGVLDVYTSPDFLKHRFERGMDYFLEIYLDYEAEKITFGVNCEYETVAINQPMNLGVRLFPRVRITTFENAAKSFDFYGAYLELTRDMPLVKSGVNVYTFQPNSYSGYDVELVSHTPTTNYNGYATIGVGEVNNATSTRRILIKDDNLAALSGKELDGYSIILHVSSSQYSSNRRKYRVYRILRDWVDTQATWNVWKTGSNWTTAGGFGSGDVAPSPIGEVDLPPALPAGAYIEIPLDTSVVEQMASGALPNYGWMIKADVENDDCYSFHSSDATTEFVRPIFRALYK